MCLCLVSPKEGLADQATIQKAATLQILRLQLQDSCTFRDNHKIPPHSIKLHFGSSHKLNGHTEEHLHCQGQTFEARNQIHPFELWIIHFMWVRMSTNQSKTPNHEFLFRDLFTILATVVATSKKHPSNASSHTASFGSCYILNILQSWSKTLKRIVRDGNTWWTRAIQIIQHIMESPTNKSHAWVWISHTMSSNCYGICVILCKCNVVFCSLLWAMSPELSCSSLVSWEKRIWHRECTSQKHVWHLSLKYYW